MYYAAILRYKSITLHTTADQSVSHDLLQRVFQIGEEVDDVMHPNQETQRLPETASHY